MFQLRVGSYSANLLIFSIFVVHIFAVIWQSKLFSFFGGDGYTYGSVGLGINIWSLAYTFTWEISIFHKMLFFRFFWGENAFKDVTHIPKILVGLMLLGLLLTIAIPLLSSRHLTSALPKKTERREFETPGEGGI